MSDALGTTWPVFLGLTVGLMGGAAYLTGQAVAKGWRPLWQLFVYVLLLGLGDRFLTWGLFGGRGLSPTGFIIDTAALAAIALLAYRITRVRKMVRQYPWLYRRSGLFGYRAIVPPEAEEKEAEHRGAAGRSP